MTPTKRIRIEVEWNGACSERDWLEALAKLIESSDRSPKPCRVVLREALTNYGDTERVQARTAVGSDFLDDFKRAFRTWARTGVFPPPEH